MDNRREFLKQASLLVGGSGLWEVLPASLKKAMKINPEKGTTFYDAEHVVFLMQENRSFDHALGHLQGVRGYNDPRQFICPTRIKYGFKQMKGVKLTLPSIWICTAQKLPGWGAFTTTGGTWSMHAIKESTTNGFLRRNPRTSNLKKCR